MSLPIIFFYDLHPEMTHLNEEIQLSLMQKPKSLPSKLFYDCKGSKLFDAICELPEYYITRTENKILHQYAKDIGEFIGPNSMLIELGSGSCQKVRNLLPYLKDVSYMPMDISKNHLRRSVNALSHDFPEIPMHAVCLDYSKEIVIPYENANQKKVFFFPGSSISNFEPQEAKRFFQRIGELAKPNGGFLIGVDVPKDKAVIEAAYNDQQGVTAHFNLNMLHRLNHEFHTNFAVENFSHEAIYDVDFQRLAMYLHCHKEQEIKLNENHLAIDKGESIRTEYSYKYSVEQFTQMAKDAGFKKSQLWIDKDHLFSVHYFYF